MSSTSLPTYPAWLNPGTEKIVNGTEIILDSSSKMAVFPVPVGPTTRRFFLCNSG